MAIENEEFNRHISSYSRVTTLAMFSLEAFLVKVRDTQWEDQDAA